MPTATATALLLFSFTFLPLFSTSTPQPRRILHQPLLPDDPSPPPAPSPPKYPFTTSAPDNSPFFQSYPSPPPPPAPASFASFPANISSITVPGPTKPNSSSPKLIIAAVAAVVAAITVVSLAVFLHLRHRTTSRRSSSFTKSKPPNSDTSSAVSFNQAPSSRHIPKLHRPSQSSSEFLYLGTLVNSHAPAPAAALSGGGATRTNYSNAVHSQKLDSPELRPLPPLNARQHNSGNNAEVISSKDDESEEFYSPKGSINGRESSIGAGSASRRAFAAVVVENFNGSTSNSSSTYSSSLPGSGSPARSASFSLSPANNQSSINTMPKSPDLIEIQTIAPLPPQVAAPAEARSSMLQVAASPSPSSSSSPDRQSRRSEEISPRNSSVLDQSLESLATVVLDQSLESLVTINSLVLHETATDPEPPETRGLDLPACQSPSSLTSSSPESSPRNSMSDRSMESPVRTYIAVEIELHNANDIPTSPELLEYATPLALGSSPRNSDQNLESPMRDNSDLQHTPLEIRGLEIPESASPLPLSSLSPERCSTKSAESSPTKSIVSDQFAESPLRSNSPVYNNPDVIPPPPEMQGFVLPESAPALLPDSDVWDWNVESPVRSSNLAQQNAAEVPTALEIQPECTFPLSPILYSTERSSMKSEESSPRNSNVSDHMESPVTIGSSVQHNATAIPTTTENEALVSPEYGSPLAPGSYSPGLYLSSKESSPRNSNISDEKVESPVGIISPAQHNSEEFPTSPEMEALVLPESTSPLACSSSSPARYSSSVESSPRKSNVSPQNMEPPASPVPESPATSPPDSPAPNNYPGKDEDTSPRMSNASDQDAESPVMQDLVLSSPERMPMFSNEQNAASPDRINSTKQHKLPSPSSSSPSSPERYQTESDESTSKNLNDFHDPNVESPSSNGSSLQPPAPPVSVNTPPPVSVPPPPPPPPPPLPPALSPRTPTPAEKIPLEPPALINPLRPIGFESSTLISPMQLPSQNDEDSLNPKPKLKPLHWDKVRASSDREMVWDQLKCSSFKLDEEMIETLFVVNTSNPNSNEATRWQVLPPPGLDSGDKVLDPKKSQNIAILLKALHVTVDEVCDGLLEGNAEILGTELLESLLKMAPSKEEERKLKAHEDDSPIKLGPAERFLKAVVDIPHAFKRVEALLYVSNFESEVEYLKKSFATLEAACEELRTSRMFLKLLEAVLKTGNRMNVGTNRGDAHAFKLDTLLKLVDVKGADGKTTLLHFVVQEIIRSEGARLSGEQLHVVEETSNDAKCRKLGLQVVSALSLELSSVKKAAVMDAEVLNTYVSKLSKGITNVNEILKLNEAAAPMEESSKFAESMNSFMNNAEEEIFKIQAQERLALSLVKEITEYFHGNSAMEEPHPFRIFMVVRDFLTVLDRVCKEVGMINERTIVSSAHRFPVPVNPMLQQATGAFHRRQQTSSDDESLLPFNV